MTSSAFDESMVAPAPPVAPVAGKARSARAPHIAGIDGLRAIAVLTVIFFHLNKAYLPGGYVGVDIFFVISGFVVTLSAKDYAYDSFISQITAFYARRFRRILPALMVVLVATFAASSLLLPESWMSRSVGNTGLAAFFGVSNFTLALNDDTYFSPTTSLNPFTHTWSLGVEEQFYLIFPFILHFRNGPGGSPVQHRRAIWIVALLSLASFAAAGLSTAIQPRYAFYLIFSRYWELGLGMALALTVDDWSGALRRLGGKAVGLIGLAGGVVIAISCLIGETSAFPFPLALLPVFGAGAVIVAVVADREGPTARLLAQPAFVFIGALSYSLYLWHWPIFTVMRWTTGLDSLMWQAVALVLTAAGALVSYWLVEQPLRYSAKVSGMSRGGICLAGLAAMVIGCGVGAVELKARRWVSLSVTAHARSDWYPDARNAPVGPAVRCTTQEHKGSFSGAIIVDWETSHCQPDARQVFVLGDSHSYALMTAWRRLAGETGMPIEVATRTYCGFLTLDRVMRKERDCAGYMEEMTARIAARLHPGDVVVLPSLRLVRLIDQDGSRPDQKEIAAPIRAEAAREAGEMLRRFTDRGARVILAAPLPILPAPAYRCSDWFNRSNLICAGGLQSSRAEIERLRAPVLRQMEIIVQGNPAISIWDGFDVLCPSQTCQAQQDGRPLFFDGDHISGYANELLYPSLKSHILKAD